MRRFHRGNREDGAALVETALVLPMLFMLTIGIWTTARAWNVHNVMDHAAREAARYGATANPFDPSTNPGGVLSIAEGEVAASSVRWADLTVTCASLITGSSGLGDCIPSDPTTDERVQVALEWQDYKLEFVFFSVNVTLKANAVSRREPV